YPSNCTSCKACHCGVSPVTCRAMPL
ncbi:lyase, partial [Klebsiella pneumoniae]